MKWLNIPVVGVPEEHKENEAKILFKGIMTKTFPNLMTDMNTITGHVTFWSLMHYIYESSPIRV